MRGALARGDLRASGANRIAAPGREHLEDPTLLVS
jgi:hypothetical protein